MYREAINGYINEGHPTNLTEKESEISSNITSYIPHDFVLNPDKPDEVKLVYDASVKYQNVCLNDELLKGPDLLNNLVPILIKFRKREVCSIRRRRKNVSPCEGQIEW